MASLPAPSPPVMDYMSHYVASENDPFDGDYRAALLTYLIDVVVPTNILGPTDVY